MKLRGREDSSRYGRSAYGALARLVLNMAAMQIGGAGVDGLAALLWTGG